MHNFNLAAQKDKSRMKENAYIADCRSGIWDLTRTPKFNKMHYHTSQSGRSGTRSGKIFLIKKHVKQILAEPATYHRLSKKREHSGLPFCRRKSRRPGRRSRWRRRRSRCRPVPTPRCSIKRLSTWYRVQSRINCAGPVTLPETLTTF